MKTTRDFDEQVKRKHPEASRVEWIETILLNPAGTEVQEYDDRLRYYGFVIEAGRWMRGIVEADGETVHNAFFDDTSQGNEKDHA